MGYYLLDHPNPHGPHYYTKRNDPLVAIVVHITAGLEDLDATADTSAEATARYAATTDRKVSWHSGSDADSALELLPPWYTAFHVQGYNSCTYGHEISKRHTDWRDAPEPWLSLTLTHAARHLAGIARSAGIPLRHCTPAELVNARQTGRPCGFLGHWELDQARRSDPGLVRNVGDTFPWPLFFALAGDPLPLPPEDDMTSFALVRTKNDPTVYLTDGTERLLIGPSGPDGMQGYREMRDTYRVAGFEVSEAAPDRAHLWPDYMVANLKPRRPGIDDKRLPFPG